MIALAWFAYVYCYKGPRRKWFTSPVTSGRELCNATGEANR